MLQISSHQVLARARKMSDASILEYGAGTAVGVGTYMTIRGMQDPASKALTALGCTIGGTYLSLRGKTDMLKKIGLGLSGASFLAAGGVLPGAAFVYGLIKNLGR